MPSMGRQSLTAVMSYRQGGSGSSQTVDGRGINLDNCRRVMVDAIQDRLPRPASPFVAPIERLLAPLEILKAGVRPDQVVAMIVVQGLPKRDDINTPTAAGEPIAPSSADGSLRRSRA